VDRGYESAEAWTACPDARRTARSWFAAAGWHVIELRWGSRLHAAFARPGGERLRARLEAMSNAEYHALIRSPAGAVRKALVTARDGDPDVTLDRFLAYSSDEALQALVADGRPRPRRHHRGPMRGGQHQSGERILADTIRVGPAARGDQMNHGALLTQTSSTSCGTGSGSRRTTSGRASPRAAPRRR
jgi:pyruvate dehydrogenase E1 component